MAYSQSLSEPTLEGVVYRALPGLDKKLAARGIPVSRRRWPAAELIVKYVIVQFEGEDKSDFLTSYGFGFIFQIVGSWYEHTYGAQASMALRDELIGLVKIRQELYLTAFPKLVRLDDDDKRHMRLKFSENLERWENFKDYIVDSPPLDHLNDADRLCVNEDIERSVSSVRKIWLGLLFLDGPESDVEKISNALEAEICRAPAYMAPFADRDLGSFLLSLRLCCELALKLAALQRNGSFEPIHDFKKLCSHIDADPGVFKKQIPEELWDYRKLCSMRYGEKLSLSISDAFSLYNRTTRFLLMFTSKLSRSAVMNGSVLILRKPIWAEAKYDFASVDSNTDVGNI